MATVKFLVDEGVLRLEIDDLASFRSTLGEEILSAFCRCFIQADRLTSLMHFVRLLETHCPHESVAVTRDLYTMTWLAVGTLREYGKAIQKLRSTLAKARLFDKNSDEWKQLLEFEKRRDGTSRTSSCGTKLPFTSTRGTKSSPVVWTSWRRNHR